MSVHWECPASPVIRTMCFHCYGLASIPVWGTKIPEVVRHGQNNNNTNFFKILNKNIKVKICPQKNCTMAELFITAKR